MGFNTRVQCAAKHCVAGGLFEGECWTDMWPSGASRNGGTPVTVRTVKEKAVVSTSWWGVTKTIPLFSVRSQG